jgi:hypothetical protein
MEKEVEKVEEEGLWRLTRKVIEGKDKCFIYDELPKSLEHEAQVTTFLKELEDLGLDIYERKGHQFMTSDGVYRIVKKISETEYE